MTDEYGMAIEFKPEVQQLQHHLQLQQQGQGHLQHMQQQLQLQQQHPGLQQDPWAAQVGVPDGMPFGSLKVGVIFDLCS